MTTQSLNSFAAAVFLLGLTLLSGCAASPHERQPSAEIDVIEINSDINLRRMVVRNPEAKGTVLFLHGFPETLYAWKSIALVLGKEFEVHAFDWPGYGLSSRPPPDRFSYGPRDYAHVLSAYIERVRLDKSKLVIYATDIGALPSLLLALDEPAVARTIIVGDFAPLDRPRYMNETLQALKSKPSSDAVRSAMNKNRDEILQNAYRRGFSKEEQFDISAELKDDMFRGWEHGHITTADAFYHYYSHFSKDQLFLESNLAQLKTPVKVVWGERDFYISREMGVEFASKGGLELVLLPGIGHYPHLQSPKQTIEEVQAAFRR